MTLEQMRLMFGLITDAITKLAQGSEEMETLTEVFLARGGVTAIDQLAVDNPEQADEIQRFKELVADITPVVNMLFNGLMLEGSAERQTLMERRGDV